MASISSLPLDIIEDIIEESCDGMSDGERISWALHCGLICTRWVDASRTVAVRHSHLAQTFGPSALRNLSTLALARPLSLRSLEIYYAARSEDDARPLDDFNLSTTILDDVLPKVFRGAAGLRSLTVRHHSDTDISQDCVTALRALQLQTLTLSGHDVGRLLASLLSGGTCESLRILTIDEWRKRDASPALAALHGKNLTSLRYWKFRSEGNEDREIWLPGNDDFHFTAPALNTVDMRGPLLESLGVLCPEVAGRITTVTARSIHAHEEIAGPGGMLMNLIRILLIGHLSSFVSARKVTAVEGHASYDLDWLIHLPSQLRQLSISTSSVTSHLRRWLEDDADFASRHLSRLEVRQPAPVDIPLPQWLADVCGRRGISLSSVEDEETN